MTKPQKSKTSGKGPLLLLIGLLGLLIATFSFALASRYFLPKMIVRKAEKKELIIKVNQALTEMQIDKATAINAINSLEAKQVQFALDQLQSNNPENARDSITIFIHHLQLQGIESNQIIGRLSKPDEIKEAAALIGQLSRNSNKLFLTLPIIKDTLIEAIKKTENK